MTRKLKSGSPLTPSGRTANSSSAGPPPGGDTASTMRSRHASTRVSVIFCQTPVTQFSLLKYQLKPQIGLRAISIAVRGNPSWSVLHTARPRDSRASRKPHREADPTVQPEIDEPIADGRPRARAAAGQTVPPRARLQGPCELPPEKPRGQEDHDRQHESRQEVAADGDGGRGDPEDVPGQVHAAGVSEEEDHGQGGAPGQVDAPPLALLLQGSARHPAHLRVRGQSDTRIRVPIIRDPCAATGASGSRRDRHPPPGADHANPEDERHRDDAQRRPQAPQEDAQDHVQSTVECRPRAPGARWRPACTRRRTPSTASSAAKSLTTAVSTSEGSANRSRPAMIATTAPA